MNIKNEKINHSTDAKKELKSLASSCHWVQEYRSQPIQVGKIDFLTKVQRQFNRGQFYQQMILGQSGY